MYQTADIHYPNLLSTQIIYTYTKLDQFHHKVTRIHIYMSIRKIPKYTKTTYIRKVPPYVTIQNIFTTKAPKFFSKFQRWYKFQTHDMPKI